MLNFSSLPDISLCLFFLSTSRFLSFLHFLCLPRCLLYFLFFFPCLKLFTWIFPFTFVILSFCFPYFLRSLIFFIHCSPFLSLTYSISFSLLRSFILSSLFTALQCNSPLSEWFLLCQPPHSKILSRILVTRQVITGSRITWINLLDIHQAELQFVVTPSYSNYNTS